MRVAGSTLLVAVLTVATIGCGGSEGPQDERFNLNRSAAAAHAENLRGIVASLNESFRSEGVAGLRSQMDPALENVEQFKDADVGDQHRPTYDQVEAGMRELKTLLQGNPDRQAVSEKLQALSDLADKLPKAEAPAQQPAT